MRVITLVLALGFSFAAFADEAPRATYVEVTSEPSGATVLVDGRDRGVTPVTFRDLKPGRHLLKCRMTGYEERARLIDVKPGEPLQRNAVLEPLKGILLLKTEPTGCQIVLDGVTLGETPRLITTFNAKDAYRLELRKAGYRSSTIDVRFEGRTPLVRNESLVLDSAVITVESEPKGAKVVVNGIERGVTPVTVEEVPKGIASVKISLPGYQDEVRELHVKAGDRPTLAVTLKGMPGSLRISSVPEGARIYLNDAFAGKAPLAQAAAPGTYRIRAELEGHATETREIAVGNGETPNVEFRLRSTMGQIDVRTYPPGATVFLDGRSLGATKAPDADADRSDLFAIRDVRAGEHHLKVVKDGYAEFARTVKVTESRTTPVKAQLKRIFKPDVEITTASGSFRGVLVKNSPDTVTIEVALGVMRTFERSQVRKIDFIDDSPPKR